MRIVIDTSIARSPGFGSSHARRCLDIFVAAFDNVSIRCVSCESLEAEWIQHQSDLARNFFFSMRGADRWDSLEDPGPSVLDSLDPSPLTPEEREVANKDYHLVDLAARTDGRIVSGEKKARKHFATAAQVVSEWQSIMWVLPDSEPNAAAWLTNDAPFVSSLALSAVE